LTEKLKNHILAMLIGYDLGYCLFPNRLRNLDWKTVPSQNANFSIYIGDWL